MANEASNVIHANPSINEPIYRGQRKRERERKRERASERERERERRGKK